MEPWEVAKCGDVFSLTSVRPDKSKDILDDYQDHFRAQVGCSICHNPLNVDIQTEYWIIQSFHECM